MPTRSAVRVQESKGLLGAALPGVGRSSAVPALAQYRAQAGLVHDALDGCDDGLDVVGDRSTRGIIATFPQRGNVRDDDRAPARHRFDRRQGRSLVERGEQQARRLLVVAG